MPPEILPQSRARPLRRCSACGTGTVAPRIDPVYGVLVPTCNLCEEQWIDAATAELIDGARVAAKG